MGGYRDVSDTSRLRYEGCLQSFRNHGIEFDQELDDRGVRFSYQDGYDASQQLIADVKAKRSVEILIDRMEHGGPAIHESVPYALSQRESTRRMDE